MKKGDKIIWNSGFGYELGTYVSDKGVMYDTVLINLETGVAQGELSVPENEVISQTKENLKEMIDRYPLPKRVTTLTE